MTVAATLYTRENPSPRYVELLGLYNQMHVEGAKNEAIPPEQTFAGQSLMRQASRLRHILDVMQCETLLDYGSGKGQQYEPRPIKDPQGTTYTGIPDFLGVARENITCFDPGYAPYSSLPSGTFDGVVCTDVLEHVPEEDMSWVVGEIFGFAREFVYLNVACYPAKKTLPNGENAHCTIQPPTWWQQLFDQWVQKTPGLRYFAVVETKEGGRLAETLIKGRHRD